MSDRTKYKEGDRVIHTALGVGTYIKQYSGLALVKWDKTPDMKYNRGENPCVVFIEDLRKQGGNK